jgi:translation initiation factor 3 subunit B
MDAKRERKEKRDRLREEFENYLNERRKEYEEERELRREIAGFYSDDEQDYDHIYKDVEEVVSRTEEPYFE